MIEMDIKERKARLAMRKLFGPALFFSAALAAVAAPLGAPTPVRLQGTWRITRILPTRNVACWDEARARQLVGTTLVYRGRSMRWKGGEVSLQDAFTREVTAREFQQESSGSDGGVDFAQLGVRSNAVTEVDLQHEDADITGATTEVPGDTVLLAGPNRIVVSACRVYYEATRVAAAP